MTIEFIIAGLLIFSHFLHSDKNQPFPKSFDEKQVKIHVNQSCNHLIENEKLKVLKPRQLLTNLAQGDGEIFSKKDTNPTMIKIFKDFNFKSFFKFMAAHCESKEQALKAPSLFDINKVNLEYQKILSEVKDTNIFKSGPLPGIKPVYDRNGIHITDIYNDNERRDWVNLDGVPKFLIHAILSAEDQKFYTHKGVDDTALLRAFVKGFTGGRLEGGSTITQQVAKNLFVGANQNLRRKFVEMATAFEMERNWGKDRILELYVNIIYMGRSVWGMKLAAKTYFDKELKDLTISEAATLAGLIKWPGTNNPIASPKVALNRRDIVLEAMFKSGYISKTQLDQALNSKIVTKTNSNNSFDGTYSFYLSAAKDELDSPMQKLQAQMYKSVKLSMDSDLQRVVVRSLQEGLEDYETKWKKNIYRGPLANILESKDEKSEIKEEDNSKTMTLSFIKNRKAKEKDAKEPVPPAPVAKSVNIPKNWPEMLKEVKVYPPVEGWLKAVVLSNENSIGFEDGAQSILKINFQNKPKLKLGDVVYVKKLNEKEFSLVQTPDVQGAVVVMDVHTGEVLALSGGYAWSAENKFNRAIQALRQPGSLVKPFTYMTALQLGIQPNELFSEAKVYFHDKKKVWSPSNFDYTNRGNVTFRYGLEHSRNTVTARVMQRVGLRSVLDVMRDFELYKNPIEQNSIILGTQETTLMNLTKVYSQIANGGKRIYPTFTDQSGAFAELSNSKANSQVDSVDTTTLMQIRALMQGVVQRGTSVALRKYGNFLAGKTGTSNDSKDTWFIGYTPDIVIGVYVGYDRPKTLNTPHFRQATGANVALPIFQKVFSKVVKNIDTKNYTFKKLSGADVEEIEIPVMQKHAFLQDKETHIIEIFRRGYYNPNPKIYSKEIVSDIQDEIENSQDEDEQYPDNPQRVDTYREQNQRPRRRSEDSAPSQDDPIWDIYNKNRGN
ncbi:MAG: transglycosylase domain-containing protein [Bdellovibrionaceae bacterium]|nr:transglycosylase domain-containing protein [Pseudobdellovibrionaceae bacterium]